MRSCIVCGKTEAQEEAQQVAEGYPPDGFSMKSQGEPWCTDCHLFYNANRQHFHPINIVGRQPLAGGRLGIAPLHATLPAYLEWAANWTKIGFDVDKMRRMMQGQPTTNPAPQGGSVTQQPQQHTVTITELAKITWQLQYGMSEDGGTLDDAERARLTARKAELEKPEKPIGIANLAGVFDHPAVDIEATRQEAGISGPPSILDQIKAQEAAQTERVADETWDREPSLMQQAEGVVDDYMQKHGIGSVTVAETGEHVSTLEAAAQVLGLGPEDVAELQRRSAERSATPPTLQTQPPPAEGWGIPDLTEKEAEDFTQATSSYTGPVTPQGIADHVGELLAETGNADLYKALFVGLLEAIDPTDSEISLAMFQWLQDAKRLGRIGTLDLQGLTGYTYFYSEPKGTTREGYTPGGTTGGRMVDKAAEQIKATGVGPVERSMCPKCRQVVRREADGTIFTDVDDNPECTDGTAHGFV